LSRVSQSVEKLLVPSKNFSRYRLHGRGTTRSGQKLIERFLHYFLLGQSGGLGVGLQPLVEVVI